MMCILLYTHSKSNMAAKDILWFGDSLVHLYHIIPKSIIGEICRLLIFYTFIFFCRVECHIMIFQILSQDNLFWIVFIWIFAKVLGRFRTFKSTYNWNNAGIRIERIFQRFSYMIWMKSHIIFVVTWPWKKPSPPSIFCTLYRLNGVTMRFEIEILRFLTFPLECT